ncbi:ZIP family metal transporter [Thalassotalea hakodatensis]|uniref:ZIP family metal transporter n=1 Tax=Thalassotalea hakodatensis TaxID=3030492 RepID=UPI0025745D6E|nr:divalent cation transporter [Thalassotalea hakodatensis]
MDLLFTVIVLTLLSGLAMPFGALLAKIEHLHPSWLKSELRHSVIALGAGALLSAVALVLVPEGTSNLSPLVACLALTLGGVGFMLLDILLKKINTPASQLVAMLADFIPESIALGAAFATGSSSAYLIALLIALQNLPEGFNAYRELKDGSSMKSVIIILSFVGLALLGSLSGILGYTFLYDLPKVVSLIMLLASGGILYSIFQDIAPQVRLEKHWSPPLWAVFGFMFGMMGHMLVH